MVEEDLRRLMSLQGSCSLAELETDIWRREAWFSARARVGRRLARWQGALALCAAIASATLGFAITMQQQADRTPYITRSAEAHAPSELLFGRHR